MRLAVALILTTTLFFFYSCDTPDVKTDEPVVKTEINDTTINLVELGSPFSFDVNKEITTNFHPRIRFISALGYIDVSIGPKFHFNISEDNTPLSVIKNELLDHQLFNNKFIGNEKDLLVYESVLPSGESYSFNFVKQLKQSGKTWLVVSDNMDDFSRNNIDEMLRSVGTFRYEQ